jgi:hypothetical protein
MPKASKRTVSAAGVAAKGSRGEDVSAGFTNKSTGGTPVHRVTVALPPDIVRRLDEIAARLNVSRQAVIKTLLRRELDESVSKPRPASKAG